MPGYDIISAVITVAKRECGVDLVRVVHARWESVEDDYVRCTNCGQKTDCLYPVEEKTEGGLTIIKAIRPYHCGWCGAKMDEKDGYKQ